MQSGDTGQVEYVCWHCLPGMELDRSALVLYRRPCPKHGQAWHRKMIRRPDGSLVIAIPVSGPAMPGAFSDR